MGTFVLKDIDLIFVSYDEPGKDAFYEQAKKVWPGNVKRVDGVNGIHNAYSKADEIASTEWFMIVDGDTWLWDTMPSDEIILPLQSIPCIYSFGSVNKINGLCYGNGGPKLWKKGLISTEKTHGSVQTGVSVDFFTTFKYFQINMAFSTTVINQTPLQAVRAGYRECVKFISNNGKISNNWKLAMQTIAASNLSRVHVWCSTGADVEYGYWGIYGARLAIADFWTKYKTEHTPAYIKDNNNIRYLFLNDYQELSSYLLKMINHVECPIVGSRALGRILKKNLDFYTPLHNEDISKWVKTIYQNPARNGFI
jgi:hypothetical protein